MTVTVTTQAELDAATVAGERVRVDRTWRDNASAVLWGNARAVLWDNASAVLRGNASADLWGNARAVLRDNARADLSRWTCAWRHSTGASTTGPGHVIDMTTVDLTDPAAWCEHVGATVVDGRATLFKALDGDLTAGHSDTLTRYLPGSTVTAPDFAADNRYGRGLHLAPTTSCATSYRVDAKRWVRVEVPVGELRPILDGGPAKCKVRSCVVVAEVDRYGRDVEVPS